MCKKIQTNCTFITSNFVIHPQILIFSGYKIASCSPLYGCHLGELWGNGVPLDYTTVSTAYRVLRWAHADWASIDVKRHTCMFVCKCVFNKLCLSLLYVNLWNIHCPTQEPKDISPSSTTPWPTSKTTNECVFILFMLFMFFIVCSLCFTNAASWLP